MTKTEIVARITGIITILALSAAAASASPADEKGRDDVMGSGFPTVRRSVPMTRQEAELIVPRPALKPVKSMIDTDAMVIDTLDTVNEHVKVVVEYVIGLIGAIANYLKKERDEFDNVISQLVIPSLMSFLSIMSMDPEGCPVNTVVKVVKTVSVLAVCRPVPVKEAIDEQNVAALVQVMKVFLGSSAAQLVPVTHELIILFGILCRQSPMIRESCCWVPPPTVLARLCNLPMAYFIQEKLSNVLLPTLIACCIDSETNTQLVCESVNGAMLVKYMENMKSIPGDISSPQYRIPESRKLEIIQMFKQE